MLVTGRLRVKRLTAAKYCVSGDGLLHSTPCSMQCCPMHRTPLDLGARSSGAMLTLLHHRSGATGHATGHTYKPLNPKYRDCRQALLHTCISPMAAVLGVMVGQAL